jgi:hypothetical protein
VQNTTNVLSANLTYVIVKTEMCHYLHSKITVLMEVYSTLLVTKKLRMEMGNAKRSKSRRTVSKPFLNSKEVYLLRVLKI